MRSPGTRTNGNRSSRSRSYDSDDVSDDDSDDVSDDDSDDEGYPRKRKWYSKLLSRSALPKRFAAILTQFVDPFGKNKRSKSDDDDFDPTNGGDETYPAVASNTSQASTQNYPQSPQPLTQANVSALPSANPRTFPYTPTAYSSNTIQPRSYSINSGISNTGASRDGNPSCKLKSHN